MRRARLVLLLAFALTAGLLPLAAPVSAQAGCPAPGGAGLPAHTDVPRGELQVLGRGWGHGVGMSQYGARGAAILGCDAGTILRTYYPGTQLAGRPDRAVPVSLWPDRPSGPGVSHLDVRAATGTADIEWRVRNADGTTALAPRQRAGQVWRVLTAEDDSGQVGLELRDQQGEIVHRGSLSDTLLVSLGNRARRIQLPQKPTAAGWPDGRPYEIGELSVRPFGGTDRQLRVQLQIPSMEQYLYGLGEMPSSWEQQALRAQAIAGRSYAHRVLAGNRPLWDSPSDQVYNGMLQEQTSPTSGKTGWVSAVDGTAGSVLEYQGSIAETFYSSSHGGQSENNAFSAFFGNNPLPYLRPVDDTRWEAAASSPVATWAHGYSLDEAGRLLGVGRLQRISLLPARGAGAQEGRSGGRVGVPGRTVQHPTSGTITYGGVEVVGTSGTKKMTGLAFVQALNVTRRSEFFDVRINVDLSCQPFESQSGNTVVTRSSGPGRIDTAARVSADHWDAAEDVVLATAGGRDDGYADALSAAALAASLDAPLLLTGKDQLAGQVRDELRRLGAKRVRIMGGTGAIAASVEQALRDAGYATERVAGPGRFDTARAAALAAGASPSGDVAVALGTNWPDAVSAGSLAGSADRVPTLLTGGDEVPAATLQALGELEAERVLLIGGTGVISDAVAQRFRAEGYEVDRLAGRNRWGTSIAVVRDALARDGDGERPALIASGQAFPDALTAGALSARVGGPVVLVPTCNLDGVQETAELLGDGPFDRGVVIGGTAAVSDRVREQATDAIDG